MIRLGAPVLLCALLAGCATAPDFDMAAPPADALAEAPLADDVAPATTAIEEGTGSGLFARLFPDRTVDAPEAGQPEDGDADAVSVTEAEEQPARRGLFGLFSNRKTPPQAEVAVLADPPPGDLVEAAKEEEVIQEARAPGFLRAIFRSGEDSESGPVVETAAEEAGPLTLPEPDSAAALIEADLPVETASQEPERRGFLRALFRPSARASDTRQPETATPFDLDVQVLTYGEIIPACGVRKRDLGTEVASSPEAEPRYRLYDTAPGSLDLRAHYITGFSDGCPRQFLAALALFGTPAAYETTRYKDSRNTTNITPSDVEYLALRARICGTPVGETCPDRRFRQLEQSAVFVSAYDRLDTSPVWADMLIHDGTLVTKDFKTVR